jgi:hypothetical protein
VLLQHATGFRTLLTFSSAERLPLLQHSSPPAKYISQNVQPPHSRQTHLAPVTTKTDYRSASILSGAHTGTFAPLNLKPPTSQALSRLPPTHHVLRPRDGGAHSSAPLILQLRSARLDPRTALQEEGGHKHRHNDDRAHHRYPGDQRAQGDAGHGHGDVHNLVPRGGVAAVPRRGGGW